MAITDFLSKNRARKEALAALEPAPVAAAPPDAPPKPKREKAPKPDKPKGPAQQAKKPRQPPGKMMYGRLPHGARMDHTYDAEKILWTGTLTIKLADGTDKVFSGSASSLSRLDAKLGDECHEYLKTLPAKEGQQ